MKKTYSTAVLTLCSAFFISGVANGACYDKTCTDMGYTFASGDCDPEGGIVKCPFDNSKVFCIKKEQTCAVGDIYYSDGTCDASVVSGKTPVGVVGYITDGGKSGGVISLEERGSLAWSKPRYSDLSCLSNLDANSAARDFSGESNTACILKEKISGNTYPAASYCNSYKAVSSGEGSKGWYLPAAGELEKAASEYKLLNSTLNRLSKTQLVSSWYWSSSESYSYEHGAWLVDLIRGNPNDYNYKTNNAKARCFFRFGEKAVPPADETVCKVGDIYYSDGTCDADVVSGKTAVGVVGYVTDGGKHGKVIALEEKSALAWGPETDLNCSSNVGGISDDLNGKNFTNCMIKQGGYPAAEYCNNLSTGGKTSTGWYLPAKGELALISPNFSALNTSLQSLSKKQLSSAFYWSCGAYIFKSHAWTVKVSDGVFYFVNRAGNGSERVRCMYEF